MHTAPWQTPVLAGSVFVIVSYLIFINVIFDGRASPVGQSALDKIHPIKPEFHDLFPIDIGFHGESKKGKPSVLRNANKIAGTVAPYVTNYAIEGIPEGKNVQHYWGALSPYFIPDEGFGVEESEIPSTCRVKQAHVLSRHGSRYPTSGSSLLSFAERLRSSDFKAEGKLAFLNDWEYNLGSAVLVPIGKQQLYDSGVLTAMQYGEFLHAEHKLVFRTTSQTRMTESALAFLEGAYGGSEEWRKHANLEVIIEAGGFNNTLAPYHSCPNSNSQMFGSKSRRKWEEIYLADKTAEFANLITHYNWTVRDTASLQLLCPYETVANGFSQFCELFNWTEWLGFEYAESLWFEQNCAFGAPTGRAQGIGWTNELLRRIQQIPFDAASQSSENATLDASDVFFPLDQNIYVDFTHDSVISSVMASLNFTQFSNVMPSTGPEAGERYYSTSTITPFAARLVVEVIECSMDPSSPEWEKEAAKKGDQQTDQFIHFLLNQRTLPVPSLDHHRVVEGADVPGYRKGDGWYRLTDWLTMMSDATERADWTHACFGEYPTDGIAFHDGRPNEGEEKP